MVHSAQRQQGSGLRVLGTNCSLHESKFRLCPEVVLNWFPWFADQWCARLADSWLWLMALCRTFDHGWVVYPGLSVLVPIGLHAVTALVALTVSSGFILAPPPYRMVNAGSCDYNKKKKKKNITLPSTYVHIPSCCTCIHKCLYSALNKSRHGA